jgi:hypothetical protein
VNGFVRTQAYACHLTVYDFEILPVLLLAVIFRKISLAVVGQNKTFIPGG